MTSGPRSPRVAIIGCGRIGRRHALAYRQAGADLIAVADLDTRAATDLATEQGCRIYDNYRQMLASEQLDGVSICTPTFLHREMVEAAASEQIHILCEKPLALTVADAKVMQAVCQAAGVGLTVGFFHRFHEPVQLLKDLIETGELGEVRLFANRFHLDPSGDLREWVRRPDLAGGGTLMNTAVHSFDLFRYLLGPVKTVNAKVLQTRPDSTVEDLAFVIVEGELGALGVIEAFDNSSHGQYSLRVQGSSGQAEVGWDPPSLRIRKREEKVWRTVGIGSEDRYVRIQRAIRGFVDFLRGDGELRVLAQDGVDSLRAVDAAYRSAEAGCAVELAP